MTDTFEELKLVPELVAGAQSAGWNAPSGLQSDAVAVIRRGNNVVLHASAGSGVVGAYGLGILDRLARGDDEPGQPGVLVLVDSALAASATADSLAHLAAPAGLSVRAMGHGWARRNAHVLVASVDGAMDAVRASALKLDTVSGLVIDGADLLADTGQWSALETLVDAVPAGAQRVLVTGRFDGAIDAFIDGHVRKAMTVPPRSEAEAKRADGVTVRYAVAPDGEKLAAAIHLLADLKQGVAVICRTVDRAAAVQRGLAARGIADIDDGPDVTVLPRTEADRRSVQAEVLSFDVPFDADELTALHARGGATLVTPRERAHLLRIARRAGVRLEAVAIPAAAATRVETLRQRLRELAGADLAPELALLEPLLAEIPAAELAAAAIRMARSETTAPAAADVTAAPTQPAARTVRSGAAPPPDAGTWVHLFVSIGRRDDVGPGDLVGAITGEAGVSGDQVGKVDIRESHSTVEVATPVAARVIEALNGRTLKGRSLRVDYDRKGRGGGGGGGGGAGPRRRRT